MRSDAYIPLVSLSERAMSAAKSGTLIAASDRLRRECRYAYDYARMSAGETAWQAPSISGFDTLLRRHHERAASADPNCPTLLSAVEQHALFRSCAPDGLVHLTPLFEDAWLQMHAWQLDINSSAFADSENTRVFAHWSASVTYELTKRNALTSAQLSARNYPEANNPGTLHLLGFDVLTRAQSNWIERTRAAGTIITSELPGATLNQLPDAATHAGQASRFTSATAELTAAISWAR